MWWMEWLINGGICGVSLSQPVECGGGRRRSGMLTFRVSSSVEEVVGRECRGAADKQAPNRCRVDAVAVGGYISGVLFVDGGFCEGNTSYRAFKQVPALNIWPACRVQGMGMGMGDCTRRKRVRCHAHLTRHHEAES